MKLRQHWEVGKYILETTDLGVNKTAYLLGNIAPDLNCIYPAHRVKTTEKRFYKRLLRIDNTSINMLRSFTLGVVTHYVCDYFCYAHNMESIGLRHKEYETNLYKYYKSHKDEIYEHNNLLKEIWEQHIEKCREDVVRDNELTTSEHCEFILEQVKLMNATYMNKVNKELSDGWTVRKKQMHMDMEYATFMVEKITDLILEPVRCLVTA